MLIGLDLDGVLCDLGPGVAARIAARFGVHTHPSTWRTYDLRHLRLGVPEASFHAFLDETFADAGLYLAARPSAGAVPGVAALRAAGWEVVGITARPPALQAPTRRWLAHWGLALDAVHHTPVGTKATVAAGLGAEAAVEDNPAEAESLARVCRSYLFDQPYNREAAPHGVLRIRSWDALVGRLCQLRLFA